MCTATVCILVCAKERQAGCSSWRRLSQSLSRRYIIRPKELNGSAVVVTTKLFAFKWISRAKVACSHSLFLFLVKAQLKGFDFTPQVQSLATNSAVNVAHGRKGQVFEPHQKNARERKGPKSLGGGRQRARERVPFYFCVEGVNFWMLPSFT